MAGGNGKSAKRTSTCSSLLSSSLLLLLWVCVVDATKMTAQCRIAASLDLSFSWNDYEYFYPADDNEGPPRFSPGGSLEFVIGIREGLFARGGAAVRIVNMRDYFGPDGRPRARRLDSRYELYLLSLAFGYSWSVGSSVAIHGFAGGRTGLATNVRIEHEPSLLPSLDTQVKSADNPHLELSGTIGGEYEVSERFGLVVDVEYIHGLTSVPASDEYSATFPRMIGVRFGAVIAL